MAKVTITIDTDSSAFEDGQKLELDSILQDIRDFDCYFLKDLDGYKLRDSNGNTVGQVRVGD